VEELRNNKENNTKQKAPEKKKKIYVQTNDGRPQQGKPKEIINVEKEVINVEEQNSKTPQNIIVENNNNVSHSVSKTQELVPTIQANSGLYILSRVSPQELLRVQDKQLENELNDGSDDSLSTDSQGSFVYTTQLVVEEVAGVNNKESDPTTQCNSPLIQEDIRQVTTVTTMSMVGETSKIDESVQIPDRVVSDMAFLKESWANLTEADAALQNVEDTNLTADQGFQIHMSKNQKKAQKKLKQSSRDSYAT
jgi:hypothetical protein